MPMGNNEHINDLASHPITQFMKASGITLMLIDWLFGLDLEIAHVWNSSSWNLGRVLYFLTRYLAILDMPIILYLGVAYSVPPSLCSTVSFINEVIGIIGIIIAESIMTIRVWALWGRRRNIGIILIIVTSVAVILDVAIYILTGPVVLIHYTSIDGIPGCLNVIQVKSVTWCFVPLIVHQTFIFSLTMMKGVQHYRTGVYGTSLLNTFYRDGVTYYAILIAFSLANLNMSKQQNMQDFYLTNFGLQWVIHSILSARMLLHLRQGSDTSGDSQVLESLVFVAGEKRDTLSTRMGLVSEQASIPGDDWFGQEESPSHHLDI